jgi:hypothetical protein
MRLQVLISELKHAGYESAARCLADDLDALVVRVRYPLRHRNRWRSTNLLERSLGEVRQQPAGEDGSSATRGAHRRIWIVIARLPRPVRGGMIES